MLLKMEYKNNFACMGGDPKSIGANETMVYLMERFEHDYLSEIVQENAQLKGLINSMRERRLEKQRKRDLLIKNHVEGLKINGHKLVVDIENIPGIDEFVPDPDIKLIRKVKTSCK